MADIKFKLKITTVAAGANGPNNDFTGPTTILNRLFGSSGQNTLIDLLWYEIAWWALGPYCTKIETTQITYSPSKTIKFYYNNSVIRESSGGNTLAATTVSNAHPGTDNMLELFKVYTSATSNVTASGIMSFYFTCPDTLISGHLILPKNANAFPPLGNNHPEGNYNYIYDSPIGSLLKFDASTTPAKGNLIQTGILWTSDNLWHASNESSYTNTYTGYTTSKNNIIQKSDITVFLNNSAYWVI